MIEEYKWFWEAFDQYAQKNHLKNTSQRKLIIDCFLDSKAHLEADELYNLVKTRGINVGLATIYRTLNTLKAAGLVQLRLLDDNRNVYELVEPGFHHDHIICAQCGRIDEFSSSEIKKYQLKVAGNLGYFVKYHKLEIYGVCPACHK